MAALCCSLAHSQNQSAVPVDSLPAHNRPMPASWPSVWAAGTATAGDGTMVTIREFTSLGLRGMGMSALLLPALKRFQFSVTQP